MVALTLTQTTSTCSGRFTGRAALLVRPAFQVEELILFLRGQDCLGTHTDGFGIVGRSGSPAAAGAAAVRSGVAAEADASGIVLDRRR
jgi:hypothetical protein